MSEMTLRSNVVMKQAARDTMWNRALEYLGKNQGAIAAGLCALSGNVPNMEMLRALREL